MKLLFLITLLIANLSWSRRLKKMNDLIQCFYSKCSPEIFQSNCNCELDNWSNIDGVCIPNKYMCDGIKDCDDGSDELDCSCSDDEFQCTDRIDSESIFRNLPHCISMKLINDGNSDCLSSKDEPDTRCHKCDGYIDCPWLTPNDEANCSNECPTYKPNRCDCNKPGNFTCKDKGYTCYKDHNKCDQKYDSSDGSDEWNCSCHQNQFQCQCYKNIPVDCKMQAPYIRFTGCIPSNQRLDNVVDCPDGSDESSQYKKKVTCDHCIVTISRLLNISECNQPTCDISTCCNVSSLHCNTINCNSTDVICMSNCSVDSTKQCNRGFQCNDGSLGLAYQFCDGKTDCYDKSDENRINHGFRCAGIDSNKTCVLPQRNLYDNVAQCNDESDLCLNNSCFQCFDKKLLISSKQVCNGIFDCYDWSDECMCEDSDLKQQCNNIYKSSNLESEGCEDENQQNESYYVDRSVDANVFIFCPTRWNDDFKATLCDGRPECRDFRDECNCPNPPEFCNDTCRDGFFIGDRYCDGIENDFYKVINKSNCLKGFDEAHCPKRFRCKTKNKVSIDIDQKCDGKRDCDDNSDERNCHQETLLFSSATEMIANPGLKFCFWFMSIAVISGNLFVIVSTILYLKSAKLTKLSFCQHVIVLNISIADFIMGIYLIVIAVYSAYYSGYYGQVDFEWRSSLLCSIIGSFAVLSSEASCLLMVLLTSLRLLAVYKPFTSRLSPTLKYKISIILVWLIATFVAVVPLIPATSDYFVHSAQFSNRFARTSIWNKVNITQFACRLAQISNKSIANNEKNWNSIKSYFKENYPEYSPGPEFGYYGKTSVCMPRFYVVRGGNAWEYSIAIISVNFVCFIFIAVGYILMLKRSRENQLGVKSTRRETTNFEMQKRISRIIITDFICWIPICIMAFVKCAGFYLDDVAYIVSAGLLLPINSAFNPLLYSSLLDRLIGKCKSMKVQRNVDTEVTNLQNMQ